MLPDWMVEEDLAAGRLQRLLADYETAQVTVSAIHRAELRSSPRVKVFVQHLLSSLRGARPKMTLESQGTDVG
jgi:DNA-binding transcriptional LysR family regulator